MKVTRLLVPLMLLMALPAMALTDTQVINYIKTQMAAGKSQEQIGKELLAKGVTPDQVKRIKAKLEQEQGNDKSATGSVTSGSRMRNQGSSSKGTTKGKGSTKGKNTQKNTSNGLETTNTNAEGISTIDEYVKQDAIQSGYLMFEVDENGEPIGTGMTYEELNEELNSKTIYGHDIFEDREGVSFEPNANMATPQNYRLGPGDEVIIDIWGASEDNIRAEISPDGSIIISQIGPVFLNGKTVAEASTYIKNLFAKKYAGVGTETDVSLTLGNIRSIIVDVMGEVTTPGSYRISPFSTAFHAIYNAGGLNEIGSMRDVGVIRNGKKIATVDFYDLLFNGKDGGNIRLQEGDVIVVPAYSQLVNVEGNAKRPMYYEMKPTESLATLLKYAGGFAGDAYTDVVRIERQNGLDKGLLTVGKADFAQYKLQDGDIVTIGTVSDRYSNQVELKGSVNVPGTYAISNNLSTLRELIQTAQGLTEDAYLDRALIYRERPDRSLEVMAVNLNDLMNGAIADIQLNKNDIIEIANINEITERGDFTINGYVAFPGKYAYAAGTTIEDLILQAGGLLEGASTAKVEVSRRIVDPNSTEASSQIANVYSFDIADKMAVGKDRGFKLEPYDIVTIRKSPNYSAQEQLTVEGQVLFPGEYTIQSRNERISSIIKRAGGLLESAYVKGAYLKRQMTAEQKAMKEETMRLAQANNNSSDSLSMDALDLSTVYSVGIDLEKALANPGSTADFTVQEGDVLMVPEMQSTVKIGGDVLFPNTVVYVPGKNLSYYVDQAGGYGERARKNKAYVVYMNGSVAKGKKSTPIEPGCQIIIPSKPENDKFDWSKVLSIATTLGSIASMTAAVAAIFR